MLDQIASRANGLGNFGKGDLDEHHTIEDTAIALGSFAKALGNKLGIERYGFCFNG
jgi:imidazoleglycerol-phosphate dehydratase/histidinol-phosphatase